MMNILQDQGALALDSNLLHQILRIVRCNPRQSLQLLVVTVDGKTLNVLHHNASNIGFSLSGQRRTFGL